MDTFTLSVTDNQKTFKIVTSLYQPPKINGLLLLCHANGFHRQIWDTTVSSLKKQYPQMALCSFDIRTHGDSGILNRSLLFENGIPVPITHGQLGQDVVQIMNQLRERFPHVFGSGIYGLGHSVGGASLICAQSIQPLFDGLVLIEPIVYPRNISKDKNFMYRNALKRTRVFDSKEGLLAKWRTNPFFQTWDPLVLQSYIEHGVIPSENGFELK
ncbi:hypothetical protein EDD86DRAFT_244301 [Gorgonomyces haynaldii]|nr:hypothetical protein EDD86DRAFT_244301 [Gorgonomyces haynaldii]